jgi:hypothetical protein
MLYSGSSVDEVSERTAYLRMIVAMVGGATIVPFIR